MTQGERVNLLNLKNNINEESVPTRHILHVLRTCKTVNPKVQKRKGIKLLAVFQAEKNVFLIPDNRAYNIVFLWFFQNSKREQA
jgi:hypothetical protein